MRKLPRKPCHQSRVCVLSLTIPATPTQGSGSSHFCVPGDCPHLFRAESPSSSTVLRIKSKPPGITTLYFSQASSLISQHSPPSILKYLESPTGIHFFSCLCDLALSNFSTGTPFSPPPLLCLLPAPIGSQAQLHVFPEAPTQPPGHPSVSPPPALAGLGTPLLSN